MASKAFGWKPTPLSVKRLHLSHYLEYPRAVNVPVTFDFSATVPAFPMLGNDQYGDCVEAACLHANQIYTDGGYQPTSGDALRMYSAVTGFTPNNPNSDQGTIITDALNWLIDNPFPGDSTKLNTYFSVDVNNDNEVNTALWLSGGLVIGFDIPYSAVQQFDNGQVWDYVPGSPIVGGHSISLYGLQGSVKEGVSWGLRQSMTEAFWSNYVSEAWMLADENWVSAYGGRAANLLDFAAINADVEELWPGTPAPFTDPGTPPPPPNPTKDPIAALQAIKGITDGYFAL